MAKFAYVRDRGTWGKHHIAGTDDTADTVLCGKLAKDYWIFRATLRPEQLLDDETLCKRCKAVYLEMNNAEITT